MAKTHFGDAHNKACGASAFDVGTSVTDITKVSCFPCLWALQATNLRNADIIACRIKECVEAETHVLARKGAPRG